MDVVVFELHGGIYSFAVRHDLKESDELRDEMIKDYSFKFDRFSNAMSDVDVFLDAEHSLIMNIFAGNHDMGIFEVPDAIKNLMSYHERYFKIVIVSKSKIETSKIILEHFMRKNNVKDYEKVIESFDIYNSYDFGSKSDFNSWQKIFSNYDNIDYVFDYQKLYLGVARKAARDLDFNPTCATRFSFMTFY